MTSNTLNYKERWYDVKGMKWLEKRSIVGADVLNSPSSDMAKHVTEFFNLRRHIEIIENPIDCTTFKPGDQLPEKPVKILFLGRLEPRKAPDILAHAIPLVCKEVDNVMFTFLGADCASNTSSSTRTELQLFLSSQGVDRFVEFHEPVPLLELPGWYNSAHIITVPSRYDTSPYVCQEAMSCGKAVIGSTAGGMPEYLDNGNAGMLIPPGDPRALADAIITLVKDPHLRLQLGEKARKRVVERYDRRVIASKMCEQYQKAIHLHHTRRNRR
jgi:glycosyltransferase involved in cell wall biosynthesis